MKFSPGDAIKFGWETFKQRPWFYVGAIVILFVANVLNAGVASGVNSLTGGTLESPTFVSNLVNLAISALISMGAVAFVLTAHDDPEGVTYSALWHPTPYWKFLATSILTSLAVGFGLVLLIVPGLIAMVLFLFSTLLVIDRGLGPLEALKTSMEISRGNRWPLFGFILLCMLIIFAGALALGVGLLVAVPVVGLAVAHAYRLLTVGDDPKSQNADAQPAA